MIAERITSFTVAPFWWARRMTGVRSDRTVRTRRCVPVGRLSEHGVAWVRSDGPSSITALVNRRIIDRYPAHRANAGSCAVHGETDERRCGAGKVSGVDGRHAVHQTAEHGEPGDAVGQDMVEHQDQRGPAVSLADQQGGGPQRAVPRQPGRQLGSREIEQALLSDRLGPPNDREVLVELKPRIVHPNRSTAPDRHVNQVLTQPRHRGQPALHHLRQPRSIKIITDVEQEYRPHLHRGVVSVGDQRHDVVPAGAIDRDRPRPWLHHLSVVIDDSHCRAGRDSGR